jgi:putative FmdB family regulatory protein
MPIYEYTCTNCGHQFELFVRSAAAALQGVCPACHSERIEKRFSTFACCMNTVGDSRAASAAPACSGPV